MKVTLRMEKSQWVGEVGRALNLSPRTRGLAFEGSVTRRRGLSASSRAPFVADTKLPPCTCWGAQRRRVVQTILLLHTLLGPSPDPPTTAKREGGWGKMRRELTASLSRCVSVSSSQPTRKVELSTYGGYLGERRWLFEGLRIGMSFPVSNRQKSN